MFEGTGVTNVDPFMFFPDPRVPITEVSRKGEFVFWRDFSGMHMLREQEQRGLIKYLDDVGRLRSSLHTDRRAGFLSRIGIWARTGRTWRKAP